MMEKLSSDKQRTIRKIRYILLDYFDLVTVQFINDAVLCTAFMKSNSDAELLKRRALEYHLNRQLSYDIAEIQRESQCNIVGEYLWYPSDQHISSQVPRAQTQNDIYIAVYRVTLW